MFRKSQFRSKNRLKHLFGFCVLLSTVLSYCDCLLVSKNSNLTTDQTKLTNSIDSTEVPFVASSSNLHETEKETEKETIVIDDKQNNFEKSNNIFGHSLGFGLKGDQLLTLLLLSNGGKLASNQLLTLLLLLQSTGGHLHGFNHLINPLTLSKLGGFSKLNGLNPLIALSLTGGLNTFGGLGLGGYNPLLLLLLAQSLSKKDDKNYYHHLNYPDFYKMPITHLDNPVDYHSDNRATDLVSTIHLPNHYTYKDQNYPADSYQVNHYSNHLPLRQQQIVHNDLLTQLVQTTTNSPKVKLLSSKSLKSSESLLSSKPSLSSKSFLSSKSVKSSKLTKSSKLI